MIDQARPLIPKYQEIKNYFESVRDELPIVQQEIVQFRLCHLRSLLTSFNLLISIWKNCEFEDIVERISNIRIILDLHSKSTDSSKLWKCTIRFCLDYAIKGIITMKALKTTMPDQLQMMRDLVTHILKGNEGWDLQIDLAVENQVAYDQGDHTSASI